MSHAMHTTLLHSAVNMTRMVVPHQAIANAAVRNDMVHSSQKRVAPREVAKRGPLLVQNELGRIAIEVAVQTEVISGHFCVTRSSRDGATRKARAAML